MEIEKRLENKRMNHLFHILPEDFFKPLTSKYKIEYADCILLLFNSFKPEISYGVNREIGAQLRFCKKRTQKGIAWVALRCNAAISGLYGAGYLFCYTKNKDIQESKSRIFRWR